MNCCHYINVFSLLQTKLLKKLGGLQKDETRQQWVKDLAEEQLQELYATDPNLEYTEQKERSLRKKLANQIVKKRFRRIYRGIMNYQFVNITKQYLHFIQTIPDSFGKESHQSANVARTCNATKRKSASTLLAARRCCLILLVDAPKCILSPPHKKHAISSLMKCKISLLHR